MRLQTHMFRDSTGSHFGLPVYGAVTAENAVKGILIATSESRYAGVIKNYLIPTFGKSALRDMGTLQVQKYFSSLKTSELQHASQHKIKTVLAAILNSAVMMRGARTNPF